MHIHVGNNIIGTYNFVILERIGVTEKPHCIKRLALLISCRNNCFLI